MNSKSKDVEIKDEAMPRAVYFIVIIELMERFSYYGIRPLLFNYFRYVGTEEIEAKEFTHMFAMVCYFCPLIGAAISDSFLGKYKTILFMSVLYTIGLIGMTISSIREYQSLLTIGLSLGFIAMGTGGVKPNVCSFGGDLFVDSNGDLMRRFFAYFYMGINVGAVLSGFSTPLLKDDIICFGGPCYFLGYLVPAVLFIFAIIVFVSGRKQYVYVPPMGEFLPWKTLKLSVNAMRNSFKNSKSTRVILPKQDFLDYADAEYDHSFIEEVRAFGRVSLVLFPLTFTWMLYEQDATSWQDQYSRMDSTFLGIHISDEQFVAALNPLMVVLMVFFLSKFFYPSLERQGIHLHPLVRMCIGAILVTLGFFVSAFLESYIEDNFNGHMDEATQRFVCEPGLCLHAIYQLPQWLLLNLGEAFFGPTGILVLT